MADSDLPALQIRTAKHGDGFIVVRGEGVSDHLWLSVRARWGSDGGDPSKLISITSGTLRQTFRWLQRWPGTIVWDEEPRALVLDAQTEQEEFRTILSEGIALPDVVLPPRFVRKPGLTHAQLKNVSKLIALPNGANFSVPGAGKTTTTYAVYEILRAREAVERMLVVSPLSAFEAWQGEAVECLAPAPNVGVYSGEGPILDVEVLLIGYQRLSNDLDRLVGWCRSKRTMVVLDEAHRMKRGWGGVWGRACLTISFSGARRDILTGTPAPNSRDDLRTLFEFVWPSSSSTVGRLVTSTGGRASLSHLFVRTTKDDLGLPPATVVSTPVELDERHAEIYRALINDYRGVFRVTSADEADFGRLGRVAMHLIAAASDPMLLVAGHDRYDPEPFRFPPLNIPEGSRLRELLESSDYGMPMKLVEAANIVKRNADNGKKTLVWSNFVRTVNVLAKHLSIYEPAVIHGGVPPSGTAPSRETELNRFRTDPDCMVLLATVQSIGEGVSLHHACHDAVYVDRTYNAGHYLQSLDRIHRLGLPPEVETRMTVLVAKDTIDRVIADRLEVKIRMLSDLLSDAGLPTVSLPDEEEPGVSLDSAADVESLLRYLAGEDDLGK